MNTDIALDKTKSRRVRHREMLRQSILDAARELFIAEGYENLSIRKVAERIEYSPTIIYHYFQDKSDLVYWLVAESFSSLLEKLSGIRAQTPDPLECLRKSGRAFADFALTFPNHYRAAFLQPIQPRGEREKARYLSPEAMGIMTFNYLRLLVADCIKQNKFREVDIDLTAKFLFAAVHGITTFLIVHPDFPWGDRDQIVDYVIDSAINSFTV